MCIRVDGLDLANHARDGRCRLRRRRRSCLCTYSCRSESSKEACEYKLFILHGLQLRPPGKTLFVYALQGVLVAEISEKLVVAATRSSVGISVHPHVARPAERS